MLDRRSYLMNCAGLAPLALAGLAAESQGQQSPNGVLPAPQPHFAPRAKRVLFLCMSGGPSHVDTFDYKPVLQRNNGRRMVREGSTTSYGKLLASPWQFAQYGASGLWLSSLFPNLAEHADKLCMLHGMTTSVPAHPQAFLELHTGNAQAVRPSLGAWTVYGLGQDNRNVPAFISLSPPSGNGGAQNFGSAFLPAPNQGTPIKFQRGSGRFPNIENAALGRRQQRRQLDFLQALNEQHIDSHGPEPALRGVIESYELAFRMQDTVPHIMSLQDETAVTQRKYGLEESSTQVFGRQCLMARRFLEAGVRFVELTHHGWDQHTKLKSEHEKHATAVDRPIAALLSDLETQGLLQDTLVLFGGEFGRSPVVQGIDGRDHNHKGFTMWMAGGGCKPGFRFGATDEFGAEAIEGKMDIHDLHATILYLLGLDHKRLTYRYAGRDFRLTDLYGRVAHEVVS